jgi:hypothetical protein
MKPDVPKSEFMNKKLAVPTVHLNGSGRKNLETGYETVSRVLRKVLDALQDAAPHGRDYYVQGGFDPFAVAQEQHRARLQRIQDVLQEIETIREAIAE